jgi:hypothetical protein
MTSISTWRRQARSAEPSPQIVVDLGAAEPVVRLGGAIIPLEPAVAPEFLHAVFGYNRAQVDTYVEDLRHRLATMRLRARRAETELKKLRASHPMAGGPIGSP